MTTILQSLKNFPVTVGDLTLYLSSCQFSESSSLKESGSAAGNTVLSEYWPLGIRITLKGKIAPAFSPEMILYTLSQAMLTEQSLMLNAVRFSSAMLCGYTISDNQDSPEVSLIFYSAQKPVLILEQEETQ